MRFSQLRRSVKDSDEECDSDDEINSIYTFATPSQKFSERHFDLLSEHGHIYWNDIDEAYQNIEGKNYFIPYFAVILCLGGHLTSLIHLMPFLMKMPDLLCSSDDGASWSTWSVDTACSNTHSVMYKYNQNSIETILNWTTEFDLTCSSHLTRGLFGSFAFIGWALGSITILRFGDVYGRKPVVLLTSIALIFATLSLYFVHNLILVYALLVLNGALSLTKGTLLYIYFLEFVPESKRLKYHSISGVIAMLSGFGSILFFMFVTQGLRIIFVLVTISVIHLFWIMAWPESPKFLYSKRKFGEVHNALKFIARINKAPAWNQKFAIETEEYAEVENKESSISMRDALRDPIYRSNLMIMVVNWIVWSLSFHIISYYVASFPGSTFINGSLLICADILSWAIVMPYVNRVGIKFGFTLTYVLVIGTVVLYWLFTKSIVIDYLWVFFMRFGINLAFSLSYFGNSEIFDVKLKSRSFATWAFSAKVFTISAPLVVEMVPHPIAIITALAFFAGMCSLLIRKENTFKDPEGLKIR